MNLEPKEVARGEKKEEPQPVLPEKETVVVASPKTVKGRHLKLSKWRDDYKAIQEMRTIEESMEFKIPCKDLGKIKKKKAHHLHFRSERGHTSKP